MDLKKNQAKPQRYFQKNLFFSYKLTTKKRMDEESLLYDNR